MAPQDDRPVHEGFEVVASVDPFKRAATTAQNGGVDRSRPRRARSAEEKDCSHSQAAEHPLSQELLGTAGDEEWLVNNRPCRISCPEPGPADGPLRGRYAPRLSDLAGPC